MLDVSGHGVAAALLSVTLSRLLSAPSDPSTILLGDRAGRDTLDPTPPAEVADRLNRLFPFDAATEQFATLLYGVLDVATGLFRYVSAGHPAPLHLPAGGPSVLLDGAGFPIGLSAESYSEENVRLAAGDRLYIYSDGLPDAMNPDGQRFGEVRLAEALCRGRAVPLQDGIDALVSTITQWQSGEKSHDDISILGIEFSATPNPGGSRRPPAAINGDPA